MALIKCGNCGGTISDRAKVCPHCGISLQKNEKAKNDENKTPIAVNNEVIADTKTPNAEKVSRVSNGNEKKKPNGKLIIGIVVSVLLVGVISFFCLNRNDNELDDLVVAIKEQSDKSNKENYSQLADSVCVSVSPSEVPQDECAVDSCAEKADESQNISQYGPSWLQGTWIYHFDEDESPSHAECVYAEIIIEGNKLKVETKGHGQDYTYNYEGTWQYKDEGEGYCIYYIDGGGQGIEIDFDKKVLIVPSLKYVNDGNGMRRIYKYMKKMSE